MHFIQAEDIQVEKKNNDTGIEFFTCPDKECNFSSSYKLAVIRHYKNIHSGQHLFCEKCTFSTPQEELLHRHIQRKHTDIVDTSGKPSNNACEVCDKQFVHKWHLVRHNQEIHNNKEENDRFKMRSTDMSQISVGNFEI